VFIDFDTARSLQLTVVGAIEWNPVRAHLRRRGACRHILPLEEVIDNVARFPLLGKFRPPSRFNPKA
jgi:hypothetical protein